MRPRVLVPLMLTVLIALVLAISFSPGLAQGDQCPALVERALDELALNCDALNRNSACYGFNRVEATFAQTVEDDFFSTPADRAELAQLQTLQTAPLDASADPAQNSGTGQWGIAVLNVQANVPNTLPGQGVVFILVGDVEVENAVPPEEALDLVEPVSIIVSVAANVRSGPGTNANVVGSIPQGTSLATDGLSPDGAWLRILHEGRVGWINRDLVAADGDLDSLPTLTRASRTPMQAFTFTTGLGDPACAEAPPSLLVVQGPQNIAVDLTANGADIQLGSTVVFWLLPDNQVQVIVLDGNASINGLVIPAGFTMTATLGEDGLIVPDSWEGLRPITAEEMALLLPLENIPDSLLHYGITVPDEEDIAQTLASLTLGATTGPADDVDCASFHATSPTEGLPYGDTTFFWDDAPGATEFRVNVYDASGVLVSSITTAAPNLNLTASTTFEAIGDGFFFSWNVEALVNGEVACGTPTLLLARTAPAGPAGSTGGGGGGGTPPIVIPTPMGTPEPPM